MIINLLILFQSVLLQYILSVNTCNFIMIKIPFLVLRDFVCNVFFVDILKTCNSMVALINHKTCYFHAEKNSLMQEE